MRYANESLTWKKPDRCNQQMLSPIAPYVTVTIYRRFSKTSDAPTCAVTIASWSLSPDAIG